MMAKGFVHIGIYCGECGYVMERSKTNDQQVIQCRTARCVEFGKTYEAPSEELN